MKVWLCMEDQREGQPINGYGQQVRILPATRTLPIWSEVEVSWDKADGTLRALIAQLSEFQKTVVDSLEEQNEEIQDALSSLASVIRRLNEAEYTVNGMSNPLVECIPNYSEARRPEVVEAILSAIRSVNGVVILDKHSDLDHNRTVVTMVGTPAAVEEAAFRSIKKAAELIDLNQHTGAHPRIGATDVVPFVPITDVTMTRSR